jgi:hypothetical protein
MTACEDVHGIHRFKKVRNILHTIEKWETNWIGHILLRNCLLKHIIEGNEQKRIKVTGR